MKEKDMVGVVKCSETPRLYPERPERGHFIGVVGWKGVAELNEWEMKNRREQLPGQAHTVCCTAGQ